MVLPIAFLSCSSNNDEENVKEINVGVSIPEKVYSNVPFWIEASPSDIVDKVTFYIDGIEQGSVISKPYRWQVTTTSLDPGTHKVTAIADISSSKAKGETTFLMVVRLGDTYQGGNVFYLDSSGMHGLIAADSDLKSNNEFCLDGFSWGAYGTVGTSKNDGKANTALMAARSTDPMQAGYAFKGSGLNMNGYSDWYIPSIDELELLKENIQYAKNFSSTSGDNWRNYYWSSSENGDEKAFCVNMFALAGNSMAREYSRNVRPIRKF